MQIISTSRLIRFASMLLIAVTMAQSVTARRLTPVEAQSRIARTEIPTLVSGPVHQLMLSTAAKSDDTPLYYVFDHPDGAGYVIASADDRLPAVIGYSINGSFADAQQVPAFRHWLDEAQLSMRAALNVQKASGQPAMHRPVTPILATTWGQGDNKLGVRDHFNLYTPVVRGRRSLTGCTATAMAQIMKHYEWPRRGQGSHSYDLNGYGTVSADFDVEYRWDLMQDHYGFTVAGADTINHEFTEEANEAVSLLMYHCGVGCDMIYGPDASSAWELHAGRAMVEHFGYDRGIHGERRDCYDDVAWDEMIYSELAEGRPVIYVAYTENNYGHTFVADGYKNGFYHINWGWNGLGDGYYLIYSNFALHPKKQDGSGEYLFDGFTLKHSIVAGIQPAIEGSPLHPTVCLQGGCTVGDASAMRVQQGRNYEVHTFRASGYVTNYSCTDLTLCYGVRLTDEATGREYDFADMDARQSLLNIYDMDRPDFRFIPEDVPDGTYSVRLIYRLSEDGEWHEVQTLPAYECPTLTFSDGIDSEDIPLLAQSSPVQRLP